MTSGVSENKLVYWEDTCWKKTEKVNWVNKIVWRKEIWIWQKLEEWCIIIIDRKILLRSWLWARPRWCTLTLTWFSNRWVSWCAFHFFFLMVEKYFPLYFLVMTNKIILLNFDFSYQFEFGKMFTFTPDDFFRSYRISILVAELNNS